ncbi:MAG: oligoribonuclease [Bdellovibrio sp.]|nr:oligoribonuclease [Bdellovibrio sp.]
MKHLFWIDLEMTGLDEKVDHILEIAAVITDLDLNPIETYNQAIFQPPEILMQMNSWCKENHTKSGLVNLIPKGIQLKQAEKDLLDLVNRYFDQKDQIVLTGNSVGNDRRFVDRYFTEFAKRLHYRLIDVSSFKEIFREKYNLKFEKQNAHRAKDDVFESIRELKFYLSFVHVPPELTQATPQKP